jgi:hypothetical protein
VIVPVAFREITGIAGFVESTEIGAVPEMD